MSRPALLTFVALLSLTMVGEGMITVSLLWSSASLGGSPITMGLILFVMNIVPFAAQSLFRSLREAIAERPVVMIILPRLIGVPAALYAGFAGGDQTLASLAAIAACLTFITFISQQCIETLMGQLTVAGVLDAGSSARLSQTALQTGVFAGNALAGIIIAFYGAPYVFIAIAVSFLASLLLLIQRSAMQTAADGAPARTAASEVGAISAAPDNNVPKWILAGCMALLALQLSGFNFLVPLAYAAQAHLTAADYGMVSAAAGVGALTATFLPVKRTVVVYLAGIGVIIGNFLVTDPSAIALALMVSFFIGLGFNLTRIKVRQALFEHLHSRQDSALWAGRITLAFRCANAGAPLLYGVVLYEFMLPADGLLLGVIGILVMGIAIPLGLALSTRRSRLLSPAL